MIERGLFSKYPRRRPNPAGSNGPAAGDWIGSRGDVEGAVSASRGITGRFAVAGLTSGCAPCAGITVGAATLVGIVGGDATCMSTDGSTGIILSRTTRTSRAVTQG